MLRHNDLDRAIDAAASAIIRREPGRSLGAAVMARVREGETPAPRRFVWMTAAAAVVLCGVLATALVSRVPAPIAQLPPAAHPTVAEPPANPRAPVAMVAEASPARSVIRQPRPVNRVATRAPLPHSDVSPIDPIRTESIVLSSIEVPQLDRETTTIDALSVEALTIEPLATSND